MRVVVGQDASQDFKQAELDRHLEAFKRFVEHAGTGASPRCTLILRSAASVPAQALVLMKDTLLGAGVRTAAILAKLEPQDDLRRFFAALSELSPATDATTLIRWTRNPRLLEAHEQATFGHDMCWSGDAMRRDAGKRNPLVLFETDAPEAAALSALAFTALWGASVPVPAHYLADRGPARPSGAYERALDAPLTALKPHIQGWPLVRH